MIRLCVFLIINEINIKVDIFRMAPAKSGQSTQSCTLDCQFQIELGPGIFTTVMSIPDVVYFGMASYYNGFQKVNMPPGSLFSG